MTHMINSALGARGLFRNAKCGKHRAMGLGALHSLRDGAAQERSACVCINHTGQGEGRCNWERHSIRSHSLSNSEAMHMLPPRYLAKLTSALHSSTRRGAKGLDTWAQDAAHSCEDWGLQSP